MKSRKMRILVAIAAAILIVPAGARPFVAVRAGPSVVGAAAVGVAAGAVAGSAAAASTAPHTTTVVTTPPPAPATVGSVVTTLPSGCVSTGGRYQCGSVWYQPYFGGNGVYYQVVAPP